MRHVSADTVKNRFKADLVNEGCELRKLLSRTDVVKNAAEAQEILDCSCRRIESLCSEYAAEAGIVEFKIPEHEVSIPSEVLLTEWSCPNGTLSEVVESTLLFALSDLAVSYTPIDSAAVSIAASLALTGIGMFALSKLKRHFKRRMIVAATIYSYENKVVPQFLKWFDDEICASNGEAQACGEKNNENFVKIFGKTGETTL